MASPSPTPTSTSSRSSISQGCAPVPAFGIGSLVIWSRRCSPPTWIHCQVLSLRYNHESQHQYYEVIGLPDIHFHTFVPERCLKPAPFRIGQTMTLRACECGEMHEKCGDLLNKTGVIVNVDENGERGLLYDIEVEGGLGYQYHYSMPCGCLSLVKDGVVIEKMGCT